MNLSRLASFLNWSVGIGRLFGIPIHLHVTLAFFLLPAMSGRGLGFWYSLEFAVLIVLSVLLHELGHALAAKRYKLTGLSIMLHGFGGFAVSSGYRTPTQALVITLAGPAATFAIAGMCIAISALTGEPLGTEAFIQLWIIKALGSFNLLMGVLNLVPCLPFDGGNALRAILSYKQPEHKATRAVAHLGLIVAPALFVYGLATQQTFVSIFGLIGFMTSLATLGSTGGVRFGEALADRRARKEMEIVKQREREKSRAYLSEVHSRTKEREERERLRRLLEADADES